MKRQAVIFLALYLMILGFFINNSQAQSGEKLNEYQTDAAIRFEKEKIVLEYPDGSTDTLRGKKVDDFLKKYSSGEGRKVSASVYRMEFVADKANCTIHTILIYDRERTRLTTVACDS